MEIKNKRDRYLLGFQHVLAMFGSTILVPRLTGLDPTLAILVSGIATLIFHSVTKGMVPVYLGSSFAFISAIILVMNTDLAVLGTSSSLAALKSGVIAAGLVYCIISAVIKFYGVEKVKSFFPPVVNGSIIVVIGLRLAGSATSMAGFGDGTNPANWYAILVAMIVIFTIALVMYKDKSILKPYPILVAIIVGVLSTIIFDMVFHTEFFDATPIKEASFFGLSSSTISTITTMPEFSLFAITAIAPIALVVFMEHIGDITTNGAVVGKDFFEDPGIHRTILGDGLATAVAGCFGAPPNTTYSENTGVLAVTKVYDPSIIRIAAIFAICLSFVGKFAAFIQCIPDPVIGGVSIILFGMISSIGLRIFGENKVDFSEARNLVITAVILVTGVGINSINIFNTVSISGLSIAAILGIIMNKVLKEKRKLV